MLAMHMINRTNTSNSPNGCSLPGFRDFLREVEPGKFGSPSKNKTSIATCGEKPRSSIDQENLYRCFLARPTQFAASENFFFLPKSGLEFQDGGGPQLTYRKESYSTVSDKSQKNVPLERDGGLSVRPFGAISPFQLNYRLQPLVVAPEETRRQPEISPYSSPVGKMASNHKHKQSEKHRRDEMGAYVQAAELIRGSLHPGILSDCSFCIADTLLNERLCRSAIVSANSATVTPTPIPKRTRNQTLEEALMWQFSIVLHFHPRDVGSRIDDIRALTDQIRNEKPNAKADDECAKSMKLATDARVKVLLEILQKMRRACEMHDVPHCACGRHKVENLAADSLVALVTSKGSSSSSISSSVTGQKRSRTMTDDEDDYDDDRRARRRNNAHLQMEFEYEL